MLFLVFADVFYPGWDDSLGGINSLFVPGVSSPVDYGLLMSASNQKLFEGLCTPRCLLCYTSRSPTSPEFLPIVVRSCSFLFIPGVLYKRGVALIV